MEIKIFSEWNLEHSSNDLVPPGVPVRAIEIEPEHFLLPDGASYRQTYAGPVPYDPPDNDLERLELQKDYYNIRLERVRGYLGDLRDALAGLGNATIGDYGNPYAMPYQFRWDREGEVEREVGPAPDELDYQGRPCALAAKTRLQFIENWYKKAIAKLNRRLRELPESIARRRQEEEREAEDLRRQEMEREYRQKIGAI